MDETILLKITGMSCANCALGIEKGLKQMPGVTEAEVSLALEEARIRFEHGHGTAKAFIRTVEALGYGARAATEDEQDGADDDGRLHRTRALLLLTAVLTLPLLLAMPAMFFHFHDGAAGAFFRFLHHPLFQFALATPVQILAGARFYRAAYSGLRHGSMGMDLLVSLGTSAAYFFSAWQAFWGSPGAPVYFEASASVLAFVLLGKYFELAARRQTTGALRQLAGLQPKLAHVLRDGKEVDLPTSQVLVGDVLRVKPGERIPVDGILTEGRGSVDESTLTGESMPLGKQTGSKLSAATMNLEGSFLMRAEAVGRGTVLSQVVEAVRQAQRTKPKIQKRVDRVASIFVPVVLAAAVLTFVLWATLGGDLSRGLMNAVAVLVIACPCALGLATPTAVMVGTGLAAEHGILIRSGESLETAQGITTLVLDKTGTLTRGEPQLAEIHVSSPHSEEELLALAASVEQGSNHPLAKAVVLAAQARGIQLGKCDDFSSVDGSGVLARVAGKKIIVGKPTFVGETLGTGAAASDPKWLEQRVSDLERRGMSAIVAGVDGKIAAVFGLEDAVRHDSAAVIAALQARGMEIHLATGDNPGAAHLAASRAGIAHVHAGLSPMAKAELLKSLRRSDRVVAMAGDGINDAPALAGADVSIAMGSGTEIAMGASDLTLIRPGLAPLLPMMALSHAVMRKIRQNLFWAFVYNVIGIPLAALGFLSPMLAGAAMAFSSVSVVLSSLALSRFRLREGLAQTTLPSD